MKKPNSLTTHFAFDVPDSIAGEVNRFIAGLRGVSNVSLQANGTVRRKGDMPGKMNGGSKLDVILSFAQKTNGKFTHKAIAQAVEEAGYVPDGLGSTIKQLVDAKLIKRVERGVYVLGAPQLPAPAKKKGG